MTESAAVINCIFNNEQLLYRAYMPYIKGGGMFVRTKNNYALGSNVSLSIQLMDEPERYTIDGVVVWITPKGAQGNKPAGIGVQFSGEESRNFCNKIETYLAGMLKSTQQTDTI